MMMFQIHALYTLFNHMHATQADNCHALQATVDIFIMFKQFFHLQPVSMESYT
jgi:hypothetical protein